VGYTDIGYHMYLIFGTTFRILTLRMDTPCVSLQVEQNLKSVGDCSVTAGILFSSLAQHSYHRTSQYLYECVSKSFRTES
jgi:hypothetical protein